MSNTDSIGIFGEIIVSTASLCAIIYLIIKAVKKIQCGWCLLETRSSNSGQGTINKFTLSRSITRRQKPLDDIPRHIAIDIKKFNPLDVKNKPNGDPHNVKVQPRVIFPL